MLRYRLYRLHAGRFQKWTLGMSLSLRIVCAGGGSKSGPWECYFVLVSFVCIACTQGGSKSGPWECNFVLVSFVCISCVWGGSKSGPWECNCVLVSFVDIACTWGGSKSGPWECNLVFLALFMHYQCVDAMLAVFGASVAGDRKLPTVDLGHAKTLTQKCKIVRVPGYVATDPNLSRPGNEFGSPM